MIRRYFFFDMLFSPNILISSNEHQFSKPPSDWPDGHVAVDKLRSLSRRSKSESWLLACGWWPYIWLRLGLNSRPISLAKKPILAGDYNASGGFHFAPLRFVTCQPLPIKMPQIVGASSGGHPLIR